MTARSLEVHEDACGFRPINCNECGHAMMLANLQVHLDVDCPEYSVACPFAPHGCAEVVPRRLIGDHIERSGANHAALLSSAIVVRDLEIDMLRTEMSRKHAEFELRLRGLESKLRESSHVPIDVSGGHNGRSPTGSLNQVASSSEAVLRNCCSPERSIAIPTAAWLSAVRGEVGVPERGGPSGRGREPEVRESLVAAWLSDSTEERRPTRSPVQRPRTPPVPPAPPPGFLPPASPRRARSPRTDGTPYAMQCSDSSSASTSIGRASAWLSPSNTRNASSVGYSTPARGSLDSSVMANLSRTAVLPLLLSSSDPASESRLRNNLVGSPAHSMIRSSSSPVGTLGSPVGPRYYSASPNAGRSLPPPPLELRCTSPGVAGSAGRTSQLVSRVCAGEPRRVVPAIAEDSGEGEEYV